MGSHGSARELISYRLEVTLLENKHQGQLVLSQGVVVTCRLPWNFRVGKQKAGQSAAAAPTGREVTPQNDTDNLSRQHSMLCDIPTPRGTRAPTQEPMILSSSSSCSLSEEEHQAMPCVPDSNSQTPAARRPGTSTAAQPLRRKRGREADDTDTQDAGDGRRVRREHDQQQRNDTAGTEGLSATAANPSRSQPATTAAESRSHTPPRHGVPSSGTSSSPATSATSAPQPGPPDTEPNLPLRPVQVLQGLSQPTETKSTVLRATNPRSGPLFGGIEIWLAGEALPTTFTLYARFGNVVTAVSPMFIYHPSLLMPLSDGSDCDDPVLYTSPFESTRLCEGHAIPLSLSWST